MEDYAAKKWWIKRKNKKLLPSQYKLPKKNCKSVVEISQKNIKFKKEIKLTKTKTCQMPIQKEEKTIWKVITTIEKKFLNHLINHVEELENVCLSKLIFKFEKKKMKF